MTNPNRTVAAYRAKVGRSEAVRQATDRRLEASPFMAVMEMVSSGKMTPEEGAAEVKRMMDDGERK